MSALPAKKFACSCGRTFANEQILKYHERVSNHGPVDAPAEGAAPAARAAEVEDDNPLTAAVAAAARSNAAPASVNNNSEMLVGPSPVAHPAESLRERQAAALAATAAPIETDAERAEKAYLAAIEILRSKRAEQESYDRSLAAGQAVDEFVEFAEDLALEAARVSKLAVRSSLKAGYQVFTKVLLVLFVFLVTAGMFTAGVGLVTTVADSSNSGGSASLTWTSVARV